MQNLTIGSWYFYLNIAKLEKPTMINHTKTSDVTICGRRAVCILFMM